MTKWLTGHSCDMSALPTTSVNKNCETRSMMQIFLYNEVTGRTHLLKVSASWQM